MNLFKFCIVTVLLVSISATSLFAEIYFLDTCLVKTYSTDEFPANQSTATSWQINLEICKYCYNEEFNINNEFVDKTAYINNWESFNIQNLPLAVNNNPPETVLSGQSSKIDNITRLIYLLNSSFLI